MKNKHKTIKNIKYTKVIHPSKETSEKYSQHYGKSLVLSISPYFKYMLSFQQAINKHFLRNKCFFWKS